MNSINYNMTLNGSFAMNMIESTVAMIKTLPEADLIKVQKFTKKLILKNEDRLIDDAVGEFLPKKSAENIYHDLEISRQQIENGQYKEAGIVIAEMRSRYGL